MSKSQTELLDEIDKKIGEVRTEAIDLSFGEILNLKAAKEVIIDPEYQRLFRWSDQQKSRFIESVLLRLPIPPVFFMENEDGTLELIDGLQRISSMIQLIDPDEIGAQQLCLNGCDIVFALDGYTFDTLPLALKLQIKRSTVRAIVIKRQSKSFIRYEMFKRLNTGGSQLSSQELRNCSARLLGEDGTAFYNFILECAEFPSFFRVTEALADVDIEKRGREELVLRFFAAKNGADFYAGHVADWLDRYMEEVLLNRSNFAVEVERRQFQRVFNCIDRVLAGSAFCKYQNGHAVGGLAPAHYEAIAIAFSNEIDICESGDPTKLKEAVIAAKQSTDFRDNVGPGANNKTKLRGRINAIEAAIKTIV
jgi:hypothetical protein